jgi:N-acetylmuramoyl-L-alanine amidase
MRPVRTACLVLALLCLAARVPAQDTNLLDLAHDLGAFLEWDPLRDAGLIIVGDDRISVGVGMDCALVNYRVKVAIDPPARRQGAVWLTRASVDAIGDAVQRDRLRNADGRMSVAHILIDPGHGGKDGGSVGRYAGPKGPAALKEKDVNLAVALHLKELLKAAFPAKGVVLTRETDVFVSLEDRVEMANKLLENTAGTVLYLAIHANASPFKKQASGFEVWCLPPEYPRTLVDEKAVGKGYQDILPILNSMREEEITLESTILAQQILAGLEAGIGSRSANRGLRREAWYVVRNARMPAVLTEVGFVTNPEEAARLADDAYLKDLAAGIYNGVDAFISRFERPGGG